MGTFLRMTAAEREDSACTAAAEALGRGASENSNPNYEHRLMSSFLVSAALLAFAASTGTSLAQFAEHRPTGKPVTANETMNSAGGTADQQRLQQFERYWIDARLG